MKDLLLQSAFRAQQAGNLAEAGRLCQEVLRTAPRNAMALNLFAYVHMQTGRLPEAERLFADAIAIQPAPDMFYNRGCTLQALRRYQEALVCFERAAELQPDFVDAIVNCGIVHLALRRYEAALANFDIVVEKAPRDAEAWNNRANALLELDREEEALASLDKALALNPGYVNAWNNRGVALQHLNRHEEAFASFERAIALAPDLAAAYNNRGNSFMALRQYEKAYGDFERASAISPNFAEALVNRGTALVATRRLDEAISLYDRALRIEPNNLEALRNRANALIVQRKFEEAARDCERLLALDREQKYMRGVLAHAKLQCCDWRDFEETVTTIESGVRSGRRVISPFDNLSLSRSSADQYSCARIYAKDKYAVRAPLWRGERYRHDKIRLGYLSADFRNHAVASLTAAIFEHHDRSRFETIAFSFGSEKRSAMRTRLEAAFDRFIDVERDNDERLAARIRDMEIDVVIDLTGYTGECRPGILSHRAAPIQASYLGFAGTMGLDYIDYLIADAAVVPLNEHAFYNEKLAYLPDCFINYDPRRRIAPTPARAALGLPETGFVFCSFNNSYKFSPEVFAVWMRLLRAVPGSVLWLPQGNAATMRNLAAEAEARAVAADRLRFAPYIAEGDVHLARMTCADLFLDTLPYNAHTTAADALWAGLPLLTCKGATFAGRVAASLLSACGLPELVTDSLPAYERRALAMARDAAALGSIRRKLHDNRVTSPLFDTQRFTRHLEAAIVTMWERQQRGEAPASFAVAPETSVVS